jgi:hypothetical protein
MAIDFDELLYSTDLRYISRCSAAINPRSVREIDAALPRAVAGGRRETIRYVRAWHELAGDLVRWAREQRPDLAREDGLVIDPAGRPSGDAAVRLWLAALDAPFSGAVERFGAGPGSATYAVLLLTRQVLAHANGAAVVVPGSATWRDADDAGRARFLRGASEQLWQLIGQGDPVTRLQDLYQLSEPELAELFGVSRQAVAAWKAGVVPADRQEKLSSMLAVGELLERRLRSGRVPGVARRSADAFGGMTLLEMFAAGRHEEARRQLEASLDFTQAA